MNRTKESLRCLLLCLFLLPVCFVGVPLLVIKFAFYLSYRLANYLFVCVEDIQHLIYYKIIAPVIKYLREWAKK